MCGLGLEDGQQPPHAADLPDGSDLGRGADQHHLIAFRYLLQAQARACSVQASELASAAVSTRVKLSACRGLSRLVASCDTAAGQGMLPGHAP